MRFLLAAYKSGHTATLHSAKIGKAEIRMFANIRHAKERYLCKLNGGNKDGEGGREGKTHKLI